MQDVSNVLTLYKYLKMINPKDIPNIDLLVTNKFQKLRELENLEYRNNENEV
jgi:hypothetical protein